MQKGLQQFILNYLANLFFVVFVLFLAITIAFALIDALFGTAINKTLGEFYEPAIKYGFASVMVVSIVQWIRNFVQLNKADLDKETKSRWRHYMFLWGMLGNAEFYEHIGAGKDDRRFKKARDFLRVKTVTTFRP